MLSTKKKKILQNNLGPIRDYLTGKRRQKNMRVTKNIEQK